jgi:threonine dehydrogenase-like Zn-dependent dehydrogenase
MEDVPVRPRTNGDVLVKVALCGVCGSDMLDAAVWAKDWKRFGHEITGVVEDVPPGAAANPGDRVAVALSAPCGRCANCLAGDVRRCSGLVLAEQGGFAEYVSVKDARLLHRLPAGLPDAISCFAEPLSVVLDAFDAARLAPGDKLAVVGGGFLGQLAALAGGAVGARVEGILTRRETPAVARIAAAVKTGVFQWKTRWGRTWRPPEDFAAALGARAGRLVVLHAAPPRLIELYVRHLPYDTTIVNIGLAAGGRDNLFRIDGADMVYRRLAIVAGFPVPCLHMDAAIDLLNRRADLFSSIPTRGIRLDELGEFMRGNGGPRVKVIVRP